MTALVTFPSPREVATLLGSSSSPSVPSTDLATLERLFFEWPYPKSIDNWEGYVFADLCEQVGWAYFRHEEFEPALQAFRDCPWPSAVEGERLALAHLLQSSYEEQSLVLGPPVCDQVELGRIQIGFLLSMLDDPLSRLGHSASGNGFVVQCRVVKPEGLYNLRFECDQSTIFYVSFLPTEVHQKLRTARSCYQMGEGREAASWLLRAAFLAQQEGLSPEAFSFLEKAEQLDPANSSVKASLNSLRTKGVSPTLSSRVVVERTLFQPEPLVRCAVRPTKLPFAKSCWLDDGWHHRSVSPVRQADPSKRIVSLGILPIESAKNSSFEQSKMGAGFPLLLPSNWSFPQEVDLLSAEKTVSRIKGISMEELGVWKDNYRPIIAEMLECWPDTVGMAASPEILDFAFPNEVNLVVFGCAEPWQIPALLPLELPDMKSTDILGAWWRRLAKRWGARPFLIAEDIIWFQIDRLPSENRREFFLADLLNFSSEVEECFEPSMIQANGLEQPFLFPIPMPLNLS